MAQVEAVKTPASAADVEGAIQAAGVSANATPMLTAQSAFETAGWAAMWNWNLGNITTVSADFFTLGSDTTHHYKAYASLTEGATDFVNYLTGHGLIPYAEAGDLGGYVAKLKSFGYFEADAGQYQTGMAAWLSRLSGVTPTAPAVRNPLATFLGVVSILGLAALVANEIHPRWWRA